MKVLHVTYSDHGSGAAIAVQRLHNALVKNGVDSSVLSVRSLSDSPQTFVAFGAMRFLFNRIANNLLWRFFNGMKCDFFSGPCSINLMPTGLHRKINASDADVVHLHWINAEMISVAEIARIKKPIVWTLHDMWAFCGMEHCSERSLYRDGYREAIEGDWKEHVLYLVDRWTWNRKRRAWKNWSFQIVTPGNWLAKCVRSSILLRSQSVEVIPNSFDLKKFAPGNPADARKRLGLPLDKRLVLAGAASLSARHKGMDLFLEALELLDENVEVVTFGKGHLNLFSKRVLHEMGAIWDEEKMALLYNAADLFVLPSRIDNFPSTGVESLACGTPVVAFRIGGLPDMVDHKMNGYLAEPFEVDDLARGMEWVFDQRTEVGRLKTEDGRLKTEDGGRKSEGGGQKAEGSEQVTYDELCLNARKKVERCFSEEIISSQFCSLYEQVVKRKVCEK